MKHFFFEYDTSPESLFFSFASSSKRKKNEDGNVLGVHNGG